MGGILSMLFGLIILTFAPAFLLGWIFKGWRPFIMSLFILLFFLWVHPNVKLHIIATPIHFLVVFALYGLGAKVRTGKSESEILGSK